MWKSTALPEQLLARFRAIAFERLERAESAWFALARGENPTGVEDDLFRDIHTLKGDAHLAGFTDVGTLCQRLEDLLVLARTHAFRVHEDVDIAVTMAIQFVGMLVRKPAGTRIGVDIDGFLAQLDQVERDWGRHTSAPPEPAATHRLPVRVPEPHPVIPRRVRERLGGAAVSVFLEHVRAEGPPRGRLHAIWEVLTRELLDVEALPLAPLLLRHTRVVRDIARELGKEVKVNCSQVDIRVRPEVQDVLNTALLHTLRNAADHGVEIPAERALAGKPSAGSVTVKVASEGGVLRVSIRDDGAGVDFARVRLRAVECALMSAEAAATAGETRLLELLFHPRFTTREAAGPVSGRGIGMDAVRTAVERVGGSVKLTTSPGQWTLVTLSIPETPLTVDVWSVVVAGANIGLALPASFTPAPQGDSFNVVDVCAFLEIPRGEGGERLYFVHGDRSFAVTAAGPPKRIRAARLCPVSADQRVEVVRVEGREAILLRGEPFLGVMDAPPLDPYPPGERLS